MLFDFDADSPSAFEAEDDAEDDSLLPFPPLLSTPPWPLHAPLPPLLFVPSLQVTSAALASADLLFDVELLVLFDSPSSAAADLLFDVELLLLFDSELLLFDSLLLLDLALLSTPPWPLHAPLPPLLFVPSLQVTSAASSARATRGARTASEASSTAADKTTAHH